MSAGLRAGRRRDVREVAERCAATVDGQGVRGWDEMARRHLERLRGGSQGDLTPTEQEVAELVAAGHRNREIGTRLFVSESTVEAHLTRIYRKLGLRNRAELLAASRARRSRPEPPRRALGPGRGFPRCRYPAPRADRGGSGRSAAARTEGARRGRLGGPEERDREATRTPSSTWRSCEVDPAVGAAINRGEEVSFRIRVTNRGGLDVHGLDLVVTGLNGTLVKSNGAAAQFGSTFSTGSGWFPDLPAHQPRNPVTSGGNKFVFKATSASQTAQDLVRVEVATGTPTWSTS